jgi:signal transduction histidine kinase
MATEVMLPDVSRHKCLIYDGHPSEQLPVVVPLLIDGLRDNQRCLYLGSPETIEMVDQALGARGVDIDAETRRGALRFSSDRSHLEGGRFEPRAMADMLRALIDEAVSDGFLGLCATGDMMWELGTERNFDRLLEYEALLDQVFRERPLRGICQYHREAIPARALRDALLTHKSLYIGADLNADNLFYVPPEILLEGLDPSAREMQGEWMCRQITRIMAAERKRDQALASLRQSEAEQRRLAEDLARANESLERRVRERTAELQALNRDLESFSYSVSHDLRAPLRAIAGFTRVLEEEHGAALPADGRALLGRVTANVHRMDELVEGMLQLSRLGRQPVRRNALSVASIVRGVLDDLAGEAGCTDLVVAELPPATGDSTLVRQVFLNLISNAIKFSRGRDRPRIEIGCHTDSGENVYFVRDNGAGFDMANADKLFGVFQRLHRADEFPGTGVGLSIVHRIIERHGGRIWAEAKLGEGATFFLTFGR